MKRRLLAFAEAVAVLAAMYVAGLLLPMVLT